MKPTDEQIDWVLAYLKNNNLANRGVFDGDYDRQFYGLLAQVMVTDLLKIARPRKYEGWDGGSDFTINNKKVDVKCERRTVGFKPHFVHNLVAMQAFYPSDYYIFCSWNVLKYSLKICGIISKKDFFTNAKYFKKGEWRTRDDETKFQLQADLYELPDRFLTKDWREVVK